MSDTDRNGDVSPGSGTGLYPPIGEAAVDEATRTNAMENVDETTGTDTVDDVAINMSERSPLKASQDDPNKCTVWFRDGKRRIDFVLAFKDTEDDKCNARRVEFEKNLVEECLELEYEDKKDGKTHFVKVHAPWEVLRRVAELMSLKMPIKTTTDVDQEYDIGAEVTECFGHIRTPMNLPEHLVFEEPDYFTADFSTEREHMFIINDKDTFFTNAQRSLMVYEILLRARYETEKDKFGIDRLVKNETYLAAFPLHDGKHTSQHSILTEGPANDRHLLFESWARPGRWYCYQPLDLVRKYFGEKVGIYFTWLGFYTSMLIPASIVGLAVFIYGCATLTHNIPSEEICDSGGAGNMTMCPLCDGRCSYWRLHTSCTYSRITYLFDNYGTVGFAAFMSIWATMFLEFWKRKQATIQYDWDVADFELEEHIRPDFEVKCKKKKLNPVTQMMEPFLPFYSKLPRRISSIAVVLFMIACVLGAVFGVIMYRIIVVALLYGSESEVVRTNAKIATSATAAFLNLIVILLLNRVYEKVAIFLTEMEFCKTDTEYEDSFTFKMFLFQFINYYSSIFYIAFFKGRISSYPGEKVQLFGFPQEQCDPAGCLVELCVQLGIVMVGKQAINNVQEVIIPKFMNWFRSRTSKDQTSEDNLYTRWEQDNDLSPQLELGLFNEYLEMVIQYGFVTIFVAAFPLAPLFALINNVIEVRVDAYKYVTQFRRPVAARAQDIGIWFSILQGVTFIAVLSNSFIIGWTSEFIPKMVYQMIDSPDNTMAGYNNWSLSVFDIHDFQNRSFPDDPREEEFGVVNYCRYKDFRDPPDTEDEYKYTATYWHVFCARLAFVIVFEHLVLFLTWLVAYLIPDVPSSVRQLMLRERHLAKEARYTSVFIGLHDDKRRRLEDEAEAKQK